MKATYPLRRRRRGTTLIEVVLGLVVLSTLLVSVAIARARFVRQWTDADRTLRLTKSADQLIEQWLAGPPAAVPVTGRGTLGERGGVWRTQVVPDRGAASLGAIVVRLELTEAGMAPNQNVAIDFVLRDPRLAAPAPAVTP